jgi:hypothetical protein
MKRHFLEDKITKNTLKENVFLYFVCIRFFAKVQCSKS